RDRATVWRRGPPFPRAAAGARTVAEAPGPAGRGPAGPERARGPSAPRTPAPSDGCEPSRHRTRRRSGLGKTNRPGCTASAARFRTECGGGAARSEEHTSELQSLRHLVCRLLLEKKNKQISRRYTW